MSEIKDLGRACSHFSSWCSWDKTQLSICENSHLYPIMGREATWGESVQIRKKINIKLFKIKSQKNLGNTQDPSKRKMAKLHSIIWIKWPKVQGKLFEVDGVILSQGIHVNIQNISSTVFPTNGEDSCMGVLTVPQFLTNIRPRNWYLDVRLLGEEQTSAKWGESVLNYVECLERAANVKYEQDGKKQLFNYVHIFEPKRKAA